MRAPWKPRAVNASTRAFAEAVDIYPTLADLAGLPPPASQGEALNGTSLAPVFDDLLGATVKDAAFSQFAKESLTSVYPKFQRNQTAIMGYSVRVDGWRYTAWFGAWLLAQTPASALAYIDARPIPSSSPPRR